MDALKSAGRALIRSPSLAKQSWGGGGRHRSECVRDHRGPAGAGRGSGRTDAPPQSPGTGVGERQGLSRALRSGATLPGPAGFGVAEGQAAFLLPSPFCVAGEEGQKLGEETGARGPQVRAAVGGRLQVRGRDLRDPSTSPLWTARGGRSSASVPGGGSRGQGLGKIPPSRTPALWPRGQRPAGAPLPPSPTTRLPFDSRAPRSRLSVSPGLQVPT